MIYQALVGAWPNELRDKSFTERIQAYVLKAAREGKEETSWLNPNEAYEAGVHSFIERILDNSISAEFLASVHELARRTALVGAVNSLSQLTLKATMPGVPDFYQGTEFWDLSLVDPDNRRPLDFEARRAELASAQTPNWGELVKRWADGQIKLAWTRELLKLRNELPDVFTLGSYWPLQVTGEHADHIIAFARQHGGDAVVVVVPRLLAVFTDAGRIWPDLTKLDATLRLGDHVLKGASAGELRAAELFDAMPVAMLRAQPARAAAPARKRVNA
jgi:(1->4)-alpha-D-glucan 1-alpha-D-glucosylmutase